MDTPANLHIVHHPIVQAILTQLRDRTTEPATMRRLLADVGKLMAYEMLRDQTTESLDIQTPFGSAAGVVCTSPIAVVPVLRTGIIMAGGVLDLVPDASVGHLGIYRDETSFEPVVYYSKLPADLDARDAIIVQPLVATGGTACAAIQAVKQAGAGRIRLLSLIVAAPGVDTLTRVHPDVELHTAAVDDHLNDNGYIVPGLGDAGVRFFGTQ